MNEKTAPGTTLSLCMIMKNEEKFLPACLLSAREWVDEIIIVDTGSTDRSVEIARSYGARVYHHPWENHFSRHRNQSVAYAGGEWILWLDADEVVQPGGGGIIRESISEGRSDSLLVTMICYFGNRTRESWNNAVKLFKNRAGIHFEGAVHNQVVGYGNPRFCPVKIYHYGYDADRQTVREKYERTSVLLKRAIQEDPDNFRHHHDLAVSYASVQLHRKAVEEGLCAIRLHRENGNGDPNILWTHFVVASSCFNLGLFKEAKGFSEAALQIQPDHLDSYFVLASVCARKGDREGFERAYGRYVDLCEEYRKHPERLGGLLVNKGNEKWRLDLDCASLLLEGSEQEAAELFTRVVRESPDPAAACRAAIHACRKAGRLALADRFLKTAEECGMDPRQGAYERAILSRLSGNHQDYLAQMEDLLQTGPGDTPEFLAAIGTEALRIRRPAEAESLLLECLRRAYQPPSVFTSLGLACKLQGKSAQAKEWYLRGHEMDERDVRTLANLGHLSFERSEWKEATSWYRKALEVDGGLRDVLLRLSLISLIEQDLTGCVNCCDRLAQELGLRLEMEIESLEDLSTVYRALGDALLKNGSPTLHREAESFAAAMGKESTFERGTLNL
jgi:glycosyltransferase involved in cell wall biosynthesis/Flp pilus assembly protein TadD